MSKDSEKNIGRLSATIKSDFLTSHQELANIEGNLLSAAAGMEAHTILITSAVEEEGKSVTALNMAYALATFADARVLLIDGNLYAPSLCSLFHIQDSPGLSDIILALEKKSALPKRNDLFHATEIDNLYLMSSGAQVDKNIDVYKSISFEHKLSHVKDQFDYVIFDGPAFLGSSSVSQIAHYFDGMILVVKCESTTWEVVKLVKNKISQVGGKLFGAVLSRREYYLPKILYKGWWDVQATIITIINADFSAGIDGLRTQSGH